MYTFAGNMAVDLWGDQKALPSKMNLEGSAYL